MGQPNAHPCVAFLPCASTGGKAPSRELSQGTQDARRPPPEAAARPWLAAEGRGQKAWLRRDDGQQLGAQSNDASKAPWVPPYGLPPQQFHEDIHNGRFIYQYELSRYHILGINLVAPIDHHFQITRGKDQRHEPMGTFNHPIISMGIQLAHIHGSASVAILSSDDRRVD